MRGFRLIALPALLALCVSGLSLVHPKGDKKSPTVNQALRMAIAKPDTHSKSKDSSKSKSSSSSSSSSHSHHEEKEKIPVCRKSMFSGVVGSQLIMYGGASGGTSEEVGKARNDVVALTFDFDYTEKSLSNAKWRTLDDTNSIGAKISASKGPHPLPGRYNGCSFVKDEKLYIFGGGVGIEEISNQLWEYDPKWEETNKPDNGYQGWRKVFPVEKTKATEQLRRRSAVCGSDGTDFFIFSGRHPETSDTNQMYKISGDGNTVTELVDLGMDSKEIAPTVRQGACGIIYKGFFFIHGGRTRIAHGLSDYNSDMWRFDLANQKWARIGDPSERNQTGASLPARNHHSCTLVGSKFYVFGGREDRDPNALRKDMWYTDLDELLGPEQHLVATPAAEAKPASLLEHQRRQTIRRKDEPSDADANATTLVVDSNATVVDVDEDEPVEKSAEELLKERNTAYVPFMFAAWKEIKPKPGAVWPAKRFLPAFETLERKDKTYIILSAGQSLTPHAHVPDSVLAYTDHAIRLNDVWKFDTDTQEFIKLRESSCSSK